MIVIKGMARLPTGCRCKQEIKLLFELYSYIIGGKPSRTGAICGMAEIPCKNCNYLKGTADQGIGNREDTSNCVSLSEAQMKNAKLFTGFDFTEIWEVDPYCSYPYPQLKNNRMIRVNSI